MPNLRLQAALVRMRQSGERWSVVQLIREAGMEDNWDSRTQAIAALMDAAATGKLPEGTPAPAQDSQAAKPKEKPAAASSPEPSQENSKAKPKAKQSAPKERTSTKSKVKRAATAAPEKDKPKKTPKLVYVVTIPDPPKSKRGKRAASEPTPAEEPASKAKLKPATKPTAKAKSTPASKTSASERTRTRPRLRELVEKKDRPPEKPAMRKAPASGRKRTSPTGRTAQVVNAWLEDPSMSPKQLGKLVGVDKRTAEEALLRWTNYAKDN